VTSIGCYREHGAEEDTVFGYKEKEVRGKWRKLHSEELYGFHFPPDITRAIK
jgi:hypothetical protein